MKNNCSPYSFGSVFLCWVNEHIHLWTFSRRIISHWQRMEHGQGGWLPDSHCPVRARLSAVIIDARAHSRAHTQDAQMQRDGFERCHLASFYSQNCNYYRFPSPLSALPFSVRPRVLRHFAVRSPNTTRSDDWRMLFGKCEIPFSHF